MLQNELSLLLQAADQLRMCSCRETLCLLLVKLWVGDENTIFFRKHSVTGQLHLMVLVAK